MSPYLQGFLVGLGLSVAAWGVVLCFVWAYTRVERGRHE